MTPSAQFSAVVISYNTTNHTGTVRYSGGGTVTLPCAASIPILIAGERVGCVMFDENHPEDGMIVATFTPSGTPAKDLNHYLTSQDGWLVNEAGEPLIAA